MLIYIIVGVASFVAGFLLGAWLVTRGMIHLLAHAKRKGRLHLR